MLKYYTLMNIMSHTNVGVRIEKQSASVWKIYSKNQIPIQETTAQARASTPAAGRRPLSG
jgi:hypothetical protein